MKISDQKKTKFPVLAWKPKERNHGTPKAKTEFEPIQAGGNKLNQNLKKHSDWNCWNFARLELRSQVLTCSTFMYSWLVMTWSITLAVLPRAGANSKPHGYKQKVQKMKGFPKTWVLTGNRLKISDQKNNLL